MKARPNYNYERISALVDQERLEEKQRRDQQEKQLKKSK